MSINTIDGEGMKDYEQFEKLIQNTKYNGLSEFQVELFSALMLGANNAEIKKVYNTLADSTIRNHKHNLKEKQKASRIQYALFNYLDNPIKDPKKYSIYILSNADIYRKLRMLPYITSMYPDIDLKFFKKEIEKYLMQNENYYLKSLAVKAYSFFDDIDFEFLKKEFYESKNDYIKYYIFKIFYDKKELKDQYIEYCLDSNIKILIYASYFVIVKENIERFQNAIAKLRKKYKEFLQVKTLEDIRTMIRKEIKKVKPTYVPLNTTLMDKRFDISEEERVKTIKSYFIKGRLKIIPAKEKKKIIILQEIMEKFEKGKKYTRENLNSILKEFYEDYASLRRYLIEYGFMERTSDGKIYWVK